MSKGLSVRSKGTVLLLALSLLLLAIPAVVTAAPRVGGTLRVALPASPPTLDPHTTTHTAVREIGLHIFENLLTFDAKFRVVPQLAEKWEISPDQKVYTFYLRKGVKFHNGKEMTAEDVKASIERFKEVGARRNEISDLTKVEIVDPYTVKLYLSKVNGAFLASMASPIGQLAILPKDAVEKRAVNKVDIVGTGPYKFVEWIPDRWVKVERFKEYKGPAGEASGFGGNRKAYLEQILFIPVPEPGARVAGLQAGEYDFADNLPLSAVQRLSKDKKLKVVQLGPYNYPAMYFNHSKIFKNLKLRQAVQAALNIADIAEVAGEGTGRLDPGIYFKEQVWHSTTGAELYNQNNPGKAKQLLKEAGYNNEQVILVTNTDYDYMYKAALVVLQQLKKVGFNIKLEVYDWPGALAVRKDLGKWDLFFSGHSTRFDPSSNDFYYLPQTTFFAYNNPQMTALIEKANVTTVFEERYKLYDQVQKLIYEDVALLKLYDQNLWEAYSTKVQGYSPWVQVRFWNVSLNK